MVKLFALESEQEDIDSKYTEVYNENDIEQFSNNLLDEIKNTDDSFNIVTENIKILYNELNLVNNIKTSLESRKIGSVEYFISLENLSPVMKSIANNLGVNYKVPSLEDFRSPYSTKVCHQIAMEGFVEFIKTIWKRIKDFILALLSKIRFFFNRLFKFDLELEQYEKYVDKMIYNIKSSKYTLSNNKAIIPSKLPSMLGKDGMERMDTDYLLSYGIPKIDKLNTVLVNLSTNLPTILKEFSSDLNRSINENNIEIENYTRNISDIFNEGTKYINNNNITTKSVDTLIKNINDMLEEILNSIRTVESRKHISSILDNLNNNSLINIITKGRSFTKVPSLNDIPDKVFDKIQNITDNSSSSNIDLYEVINSRNIDGVLPYSYNIYVAVIKYTDSDNNTKYKYVTVSNKEEIHGIANELNPLSNKDNLINLYADYKSKYSKINVKSISNAILSSSKLESIIRDANENITRLADIIEGIYNDIKTFNFIKGDISKEIMNDIYNNDQIKENKDSVAQKLNELKKYINIYTTTISSLLQFAISFMKTSSYDTVSLYTEVKYELIKYIYNNCTLYTK